MAQEDLVLRVIDQIGESKTGWKLLSWWFLKTDELKEMIQTLNESDAPYQIVMNLDEKYAVAVPMDGEDIRKQYKRLFSGH